MTHEDDYDPAAQLTARIASVGRRIAIVVFFFAAIGGVLALCFAEPSNPGRVAFTSAMGAVLVVALLVKERRS